MAGTALYKGTGAFAAGCSREVIERGASMLGWTLDELIGGFIMASVVAVCISEKKGTPKQEVPEIQLKIDHGIIGDAHAGNWHRQVSLLGEESVAKMKKIFPDIPIGAFAENILTEGLTLYTLPVGSRLRIGDVLLQVTQIGKECHAHCAIRQQIGDCVMPREGIFAIVLEEGTIRHGDTITLLS